MQTSHPIYLETYKSGELSKKITAANAALSNCTLCPRKCQVNRFAGETGVCNTGNEAVISSYNPHFGEEAPLVGKNGSGTIFFTHCNLLCLFCQNYEISHQGDGSAVSTGYLAEIMLTLQNAGCHNINFVTPSHVVPQILTALPTAIEDGLNIPLVYNSSGYDRVSTLELLDGVIDIYMPDFKFWDANVSKTICDAPDYPEVTRKAITEMYEQVGDLVIDKNGVAQRGLLLRHLVLPKGLSGTRSIMDFIANEISTGTYVNVMSQYRPCGRAEEVAALDSTLTPDEYKTAVRQTKEAGIKRLDRRPWFFTIF